VGKALGELADECLVLMPRGFKWQRDNETFNDATISACLLFPSSGESSKLGRTEFAEPGSLVQDGGARAADVNETRARLSSAGRIGVRENRMSEGIKRHQHSSSRGPGKGRWPFP
jgi:hypothetical protein